MSESLEDIAAGLDVALVLFLKSYIGQTSPHGERVSRPGFAAVTVNVLACFDGGKQVFLKVT